MAPAAFRAAAAIAAVAEEPWAPTATATEATTIAVTASHAAPATARRHQIGAPDSGGSLLARHNSVSDDRIERPGLPLFTAGGCVFEQMSGVAPDEHPLCQYEHQSREADEDPKS